MASKYQKYLPIGVAVAAGALILFFARKSSAAPIPVGPTPTPTPTPTPAPTPTPTPAPSGGGGAKVNAPAFPMSETDAKNSEPLYVNSEHSEWAGLLSEVMAANGNPTGSPSPEDYQEARRRANISSGRTIPSVLADEAFVQMYGIDHIPSGSKRGTGWQPYIDSWTRMYNTLKKMQWTAG